MIEDVIRGILGSDDYANAPVSNGTIHELIDEITQLRQRIAELESSNEALVHALGVAHEEINELVSKLESAECTTAAHKRSQGYAFEDLAKANNRIKELEYENSLYAADQRRIWEHMPDLYNAESSYTIYEAVGVLASRAAISYRSGYEAGVYESTYELTDDAARYRWLRKQKWDTSPIAAVYNPKMNVKLGSYCPCGDLLDEEIDRAMGQEKVENLK